MESEKNFITKSFPVEGMHCSSCASVISMTLKETDGISNAEANYATETVRISFENSKINESKIASILSPLGYKLNFEENAIASPEIHNNKLDSKKLELEWMIPITFLYLVVMVWELIQKYFPIYPLPLPMSLWSHFQFLSATTILFVAGREYLWSIIRFIRFRVANMDTLVGIGTLTAWSISSMKYLLPAITETSGWSTEVYFEVVVVVIAFVKIGKYLEMKSKLSTQDAIQKLIGLTVKKAIIEKDGKEIEIDSSMLNIGDVMIIKPAAKIPTDGIIIAGSSEIDESMITGEPLPVVKNKGDTIVGATINTTGYLKVKVTKTGEETFLAQIISLVEKARSSKASVERLVDFVASKFVYFVLIVAVLTFFGWMSLGRYFFPYIDFSFALFAAIGVLVVACPCAMGLATPLAVVASIGNAARKGILFSDADAIERLTKVKYAVFDKTGTMTNGTPKVTDWIIEKSFEEKHFTDMVFSLESQSEHPIATAITTYASSLNAKSFEVKDFLALVGVGVVGRIEKKEMKIISVNAAREEINIDEKQIAKLQSEGKTVLVVIISNKLAGLIAVTDSLRDGAADLIARLEKMHITSYLLSGDDKNTVALIAEKLGIKKFAANLKPADKSEYISQLKKNGIVVMVGDGINDAPALAVADVGVAVSTGTDVAISASAVTLLGGNVNKLVDAIILSKKTMRIIKENLFWAFFYNFASLPIAAGIFFPLTGWLLSPALAGVAMAASSVSVVVNSLRLRR